MDIKNYFLKHAYKYIKQSFPFITVIVIVDLLPLIAVTKWGWSAIEALYLYTLETIILLWFTLRKMWRSKYVLALFASQVNTVAGKISEHQPTMNIWNKLPKFSWLLSGTRGLLYFIFIVLWIPFMILQLMIISATSGDGFGFWGFLTHNSGQLNLGFASFNLLYVFLVLLLLEHAYAYRTKFVKKKEYENTGLLNEGLSFSLRVFIQQFIIIGFFALIGWMHIDSFWMICIILFKTFMDIMSYLFNRMWGGLTDKKEGKE